MVFRCKDSVQYVGKKTLDGEKNAFHFKGVVSTTPFVSE